MLLPISATPHTPHLLDSIIPVRTTPKNLAPKDCSEARQCPTGAGVVSRMLTGMKLGYARISATGQNLNLQVGALTAAECYKIYTNHRVAD